MERVYSGQILTFELDDEDNDYSGRKEEIQKWAKDELGSYGALADVVVRANDNAFELAAYFPKGFAMDEGQHEVLLTKIQKKILHTWEQDKSTMEVVEYHCYSYDEKRSLKDILAEEGFKVRLDDDFRVKSRWQYGLKIRSGRSSKLGNGTAAWFCTLYFEQFVAN
jgi:hypothetical protein